MATGSQNMTTFNAKHIIGDSTNADWAGALLHSGRDGKTSGIDTWIFADDYGSASSTYGILHRQSDDKIIFIGASTNRFWNDLNTGDTYIGGKLGINYDPETSGNNYQLYMNGNAYIYQANSNVSTQQAPGLRVDGKIDIYDNVTGGGVANSLLNILYNGTHDYGVPVKIHSYGGDSPAIRFSKSASIDDINKEVNTSWTVGMYYNSADAFAITRGRGPAGWGTADLVINSSGNVGIGTTSPTYKLQVEGSSYFANTITGDATSAWHMLGGRPANTTNFNTYFETAGNLHHDNPARTDAELTYNRFYLSHSDQTTYGPSALNLPVVDQHVLSFGIDNGVAHSRHIAFDIRTNAVYVRARNNSTWTNWEQIVRNTGTWGISITGNAASATAVLDAGDTSKKITIRYQGSGASATDWIPMHDTNGNLVPVSSTNLANKVRDKASGTWSISISGNAATATTWQTARTLTVGNKGQSVNGSANVSWTLNDILYNATTIGTSTSWDQTGPSVYYVASSTAFTGTNNPSNNSEIAPYTYGQLIVSRAGNGGVLQVYAPHTGSSGAVNAGLRYRTGWNSAGWQTWSTLLDDRLWRKYIFCNKNINRSQLTVSDSTWNIIPSGAIDIFGLSFKDTALSNDTGDIRMWLQGKTTLHIQIDGAFHASEGFVGNVTGNCSGSSGSCTGNSATTSKLLDSAHSWTATEVYNYMTDRVLKAGDTMTGQLYINYNQDVGLNQNGSLIIGGKGGQNIGIDGNEIMARSNSKASTLYLNNEGGQVYVGSGGVNVAGQVAATWLHVVNNSSNNSDDAMVYLESKTTADWAVKINKGGNRYGVYIDSLDQDDALRTNGYIRGRAIWANQGSNGERQVGVDSSTSGNLYFYANTSGKGIYSGSGYSTGSILSITSSGRTLYCHDTWGDKVRIVSNWVGFYGSTHGGTRYGYIQCDVNRMYFRKENSSTQDHYFDFGSAVYIAGELNSGGVRARGGMMALSEANSGNCAVWFVNSTNTESYWKAAVQSDKEAFVFYRYSGTTPQWRFAIRSNGTTSTSSSRKIKHNIQDINFNTGYIIDRMKPVSYIVNGDTTNQITYGFIYEDLVQVLPNVCVSSDGNVGIMYTTIIPVLTKEIQNLRKRLAAVETELNYYRSKI